MCLEPKCISIQCLSDRDEPLFMPSKNMLLTNKSRKKSPKNCYNKTPLVFCKNINAKIHKTLKNSTKLYSNTEYYDFVACNINGVTYVTCENIKIVLNQINLKMQISILCFIDKT